MRMYVDVRDHAPTRPIIRVSECVLFICAHSTYTLQPVYIHGSDMNIH